MKKIKAYTSMNERDKIRYYREFEIVDSIPTIGESFGFHFGDGVKETVKEIAEIKIDIEQGSDSAYDYDYYKVVTDWYDMLDEETTDQCYYYALKK